MGSYQNRSFGLLHRTTYWEEGSQLALASWEIERNFDIPHNTSDQTIDTAS